MDVGLLHLAGTAVPELSLFQVHLSRGLYQSGQLHVRRTSFIYKAQLFQNINNSFYLSE